MSPVRSLLLTDVVDGTASPKALADVRTAEVGAARDDISRDLLAQTPLGQSRCMAVDC